MADSTSDTGDTNISDQPQNPDELASLKAELEQLRRDNASFKSSFETERANRIQAEQRGMSEAERRIAAEESACKSSIDGLNAEADNIEAEIARLADEPGHGKEIAQLNRRLSTVTAKVQSEEQRQTWLAGQREAAKAKSAETQSNNTQKLANGTPLTEFAPEVQNWFKEHPRSFTDPAYLDRAVAAASYATRVKGLQENTREYFDFVEQELDGRTSSARAAPPAEQEPDGEELAHTVRAPQSSAAGPGSMRQAMAAVAPPSRSAASPSGTGPRRQPLLTADEREVADKLYSDKFNNSADRYLHYSKMKDYQKTRNRAGFGAN